MNYKDYFKKLEGSPDYREAERKYKLILDLADEILRLRIEKGWSQAELAERAGTKQANISRLESGLSNPSVNFLLKVAKALDANLSIHVSKPPRQKIHEGFVEQGKIILKPGAKLPETAHVYVILEEGVISVSLDRKKSSQIPSPRLAVNEQAAKFELTVTDEKKK